MNRNALPVITGGGGGGRRAPKCVGRWWGFAGASGGDRESGVRCTAYNIAAIEPVLPRAISRSSSLPDDRVSTKEPFARYFFTRLRRRRRRFGGAHTVPLSLSVAQSVLASAYLKKVERFSALSPKRTTNYQLMWIRLLNKGKDHP